MLEHYKVSRESLREGLRLLEVQGLISIRRGPGGGPMVGTVDPANLGRISTLFYHLAGATYRELFEAWVLAESMLAERAARNPDAAAAPGADGAVPRRTVGRRTARRVHPVARRVPRRGRVAGPEPSARAVAADDGAHRQPPRPLAYDPRTLRETMDREHHDIAAAIVAGRPRRAQPLMQDHIQAVAEITTEAMGPLVDDSSNGTDESRRGRRGRVLDMRIGLTAYDVHAAELLELARAADEAGFDSLWLGEHIVLPIGYDTPHPTKQQPGGQHHTGPIVSPETELVDPLLNLGAAAAVTKTTAPGDRDLRPPAAPSTGDRQIDVHAAGDRPGPVHVRRRRSAG